MRIGIDFLVFLFKFNINVPIYEKNYNWKRIHIQSLFKFKNNGSPCERGFHLEDTHHKINVQMYGLGSIKFKYATGLQVFNSLHFSSISCLLLTTCKLVEYKCTMFTYEVHDFHLKFLQ